MLTEKELEVLKRRARGETQQEIALALHISQAAVSKFERNSHKKILESEQVLALCKKAGITTTEGATGKHIAYKRGRRR